MFSPCLKAHHHLLAPRGFTAPQLRSFVGSVRSDCANLSGANNFTCPITIIPPYEAPQESTTAFTEHVESDDKSMVRNIRDIEKAAVGGKEHVESDEEDIEAFIARGSLAMQAQGPKQAAAMFKLRRNLWFPVDGLCSSPLKAIALQQKRAKSNWAMWTAKQYANPEGQYFMSSEHNSEMMTPTVLLSRPSKVLVLYETSYCFTDGQGRQYSKTFANNDEALRWQYGLLSSAWPEL